MQQRSEETRTHIMEAALRRFANHGYNAASVDEICAEAGVSKGAFYHHFASKQAIFLALLERWLQSVDATLATAHQPSVPATLLNMADMLPNIFAVADGRLPMFLEFWLQASRNEKVWAATVAPYQRYQQYFAEMVRQGIAEGSFRADIEVEATAQAIVALAVGLVLEGLLASQDTDWSKTTHVSMDVLLNGLKK
jgi:AcrR family transcriptional regulator